MEQTGGTVRSQRSVQTEQTGGAVRRAARCVGRRGTQTGGKREPFTV